MDSKPLTDPTGASPLRKYGYAPGGYMGRCLRCGLRMLDVDKRATCCEGYAIAALRAEQGTLDLGLPLFVSLSLSEGRITALVTQHTNKGATLVLGSATTSLASLHTHDVMALMEDDHRVIIDKRDLFDLVRGAYFSGANTDEADEAEERHKAHDYADKALTNFYKGTP